MLGNRGFGFDTGWLLSNFLDVLIKKFQVSRNWHRLFTKRTTASPTLFNLSPGPSCSKGGELYPPDKSLSNGQHGLFFRRLSTG